MVYLLFLINYGCSSVGRALVSKTKGREFEPYRPCKRIEEMDGIKSYLLESYDEMVHKVSWPNWSSLQNSAIVVLFTTFLFAMVVYAMDSVFGQMMKLYYIEIFGS